MIAGKAIFLVSAVFAIVIFMYVILPQLRLKVNQGKLLRALIFSVIVIVLAIDFIEKEKYWYLVILTLGSLGFGIMLYDSKKKNE